MYSVFHFPWIVYLKLCTTVLSYLYFMRALSSKFVAKSGIKWGLYEIFPTPAVLVLHPSGNILLHLSWYNCIWMHIIQFSVLLKCKHNVKISFILGWKKQPMKIRRPAVAAVFFVRQSSSGTSGNFVHPGSRSKKGIIIQFPAHFRKEMEKRIQKK